MSLQSSQSPQINVNGDIVAQRLAKIAACFLDFGADGEKNIHRLTALAGELARSTNVIYYRFEGTTLSIAGHWQPPQAPPPSLADLKSLCAQTLAQGKREPVVVHDRKEEDPSRLVPSPSRLQTTVVYPVTCAKALTGALCVFYGDEDVPVASDRGLIAMIASAVGIEEERLTHERHELRDKMHQLTLATMAREERILSLKQEVNDLLAQQGFGKKYGMEVSTQSPAS